jgi:hypothetical protein
MAAGANNCHIDRNVSISSGTSAIVIITLIQSSPTLQEKIPFQKGAQLPFLEFSVLHLLSIADSAQCGQIS